MMLKDGGLVVEQYLAKQPSGQTTCNTPFWPLMGQVGSWRGPIQSIGWSCQTLVHMVFVPTIPLNLQLQQVPNLYLLGIEGRG